MAIYRRPGIADLGTGPSPILYNQIPPEVLNGGIDAKGFAVVEDFARIPDSTTAMSGYTVTNTNGTLVDAGVEGGALTLTLAGSDNDLIQLQGSEIFYVDVDSTIVAECRFKLVDVLQTDSFFGLSITDTSIGAGIPSDCVAMGTADSSANIVYVARKNGTGSYTDTGEDAVDATYVKLGFKITGESKVDYYVNGVWVKSATTNLPNDEQLAISLSNMAGEGVANNMEISFMYAAQWYA